jgi:hypothetical protein
MIRVVRPPAVPTVLATQGAHATRTFCSAYDADPARYQSGTGGFEFSRDIYGAEEVKGPLRKAQHDKCCFCESKVPHVSPGDVEHFRPKAAVREAPGGPLLRPGYYWLAYEWTNLFFCCELCNRRGKGNYFPLRNNASRARSHHQPVARERPLFVNPEEDPTPHLGFREEYVYPRSARGRVTGDALDLNREALAEKRRSHLAFVKELLASLRVFAELVRHAKKKGRKPDAAVATRLAEIEAFIDKLTLDSEEFAAMTRAHLRARRYRRSSP